ncbi:hypothetical protein KR093_004557, partial [Drosophila rubida]
QILKDCRAENGISSQDSSWDVLGGKIKPEDVKQNIKCNIKCTYLKLGFIDDKGNMISEKLLQHYTKDPIKSQVEKALKICGSIVGVDPCDKAYKLKVCLDGETHEVVGE